MFKKRVAAFLLTGALCVTSVFPAGAAELDGTLPAFEETSVDTEETDAQTQAEEAAQELPVSDAEDADSSADTERSVEGIPEEAFPEEVVEDAAPEEAPSQDAVQDIPADAAVPAEDGASEGLAEADLALIDDFGTGSEVQEDGLDAADSIAEEAVAEDGYTLGEHEVYVSNWEFRKLADEIQFRLAEPVPVSAKQASASEEVTDSIPETEIREEEVPQEDDGFVPLSEEAAAQAGASETGKREYYTREDGLVHIITVETDGTVLTEGDYLFDENGIMLTGIQTDMTGAGLYLTGSEDAVLRAGAGENTTPTPSNSDIGTAKKNYWNWDGKAFHYYGADGREVSIAAVRADAKKNASTYTGYFTINGANYFLKDDGTPYVNDYTNKEGIYQGTYYLYPTPDGNGIPGKMAVNTWVYLKLAQGERWRYYDGTGRTDTSKVKITVLDKNLNPAVGDKKYALTADGFVYKKAALIKLDKNLFYGCNAKGVVYQDQVAKIGKVRYYFTAEGRTATWKKGWHRCPGASNRYYYFSNNFGKIKEKKGWFWLKGTNGKYGWFYFPKNGNHYVSKWTSKNRHYFNADGTYASGLTKINGKYYFFAVSTKQKRQGNLFKNQLFTYNKKKYYATANGSLLQNKWKKISGKYYYFQKNCSMAINKYVVGPDKTTHGYVDSTGAFKTGWVVVNDSQNQVKYLNPSADGFLTNTSATIGGIRYYFDSDGYRVYDVTKFSLKGKTDDFLTKLHKGKYKYYLECDKANGVVTVYADTTEYGKVPVRCMRTSVGRAATPTPSGTFTIQRVDRWQWLMGPSWGQYGSRVYGGIMFHSIPGSVADIYRLNTGAYDNLGNAASHGCMRLCVADAKWIYDKCNGSTIKIFDGTYTSSEINKGPLGRRPLVRRYGTGNFDPTDPAIVGNKYY